jgi:hypothetical protein
MPGTAHLASPAITALFPVGMCVYAKQRPVIPDTLFSDSEVAAGGPDMQGQAFQSKQSGLKRWGMWAHVWQHAAVKVGHDLGHACAGSLGRPVDHHPGGAKHQRYAVRHVEHPRHSNVRVAHQKPAQQLSRFSGYLRCLGECLYYCGLLTCLQICVAMGQSWKLDVLKDASQIA